MVSAYEEAILQIKNQIDIVEIISEEIVLKKREKVIGGYVLFMVKKHLRFL